MTTRDAEKNAVRRAGFVSRGCELLPNLQAAVYVKATELYGDVGGERYHKLTVRLERRQKAWETFAKGKPFEIELRGEVLPDGHLDARFAQCIRAVRDVRPDIGCIFGLTAAGVAISWDSGRYMFHRAVFIPPAVEDGKVGTIDIAEALLRKGGLFRLERNDAGFRMLSLEGAFPTWRLLLRLTRELGPRGRAEAIRRSRAGIPFEFTGSGRNDVRAVLRAGKMPREVRDEFERQSALYAGRLLRVKRRLDELTDAGRTEAEAFAAQPDCQGAQFEAARQELHDHFKATQQRIMRVMEECCYKRDIPEVALVAVPRCWPRTRPGLSHRLYSRWDAAKAGFTAAVEALRTAGQVPVEMMADRHGQGVLLTLD